MHIQTISLILCLCVGLVISQGSIADNHSHTKASKMDTKATRALVEQFNEAWVNNDAEMMAPLVSDDVLQTYPPHENTREGRDEVVSYITAGPGSTAETVLKVDTMERTVHKLVVEDDTAVGFHLLTAELHDGSSYSNEYVWRYTCADGKVVRLDGMVDRLHVLNQIGDQPFLSGSTGSTDAKRR